MVGDRVAVVGAGMVGCCVARLLSAIPGVEVTLVDVDPTRAEVADASGVAFAHPSEAHGRPRPRRARERHRGRAATLARAAGTGRATVVDLSWYGDPPVRLRPRRRLPLRPACGCAPARSARWRLSRRHRRTRGDRLALALDLLRDPAFDALLTGALGVRGPARADGRPERRPAGRALPHDHLPAPTREA